jgi:hypothetical protein
MCCRGSRLTASIHRSGTIAGGSSDTSAASHRLHGCAARGLDVPGDLALRRRPRTHPHLQTSPYHHAAVARSVARGPTRRIGGARTNAPSCRLLCCLGRTGRDPQPKVQVPLFPESAWVYSAVEEGIHTPPYRSPHEWMGTMDTWRASDTSSVSRCVRDRKSTCRWN